MDIPLDENLAGFRCQFFPFQSSDQKQIRPGSAGSGPWLQRVSGPAAFRAKQREPCGK